MREYEQINRKLISEGYTADNHPDYIKIGGHDLKPTLENFEGRFIYKRDYPKDKTFKAPCGLMCKYRSTWDNLSYNGYDYSYENDLAILYCPKGCSMCKMRHEGLRGMDGVGKYWCAVSMTDIPYAYEGSAEELNDTKDRIKEEKRQAFIQSNDKICSNHMTYDGEWHYNYDVNNCLRMKCTNIMAGTCPVFPQNKDKGNVFYDLVISYTRDEDKGTLFEGKVYTEITKGKQYFDSPVSLTLANIVAAKYPEKILEKEKGRYSQELFFTEYHGRYFTVDVQNIKAAKKETRDLEQDLADIAAGIRVSHHRDEINKEKKAKSQRRSERVEKKKIALRKKLVKVGIENLEEYSLDKKHAKQWFTPEELGEIENERKSLIGAGLRQMDIFDII